MTGRVHIVGGGLAGLSCAVELTEAGIPVTLYEAAGHAGGRCRSWRDAQLDREIDNGNHLLLSGNRAALDYLRKIGASDELTGPAEAALPFMDLESGECWQLRPSAGRIPWWLLSSRRRVPGAGMLDHLQGLMALRGAVAEATVGGMLGNHPLYWRLWQPMAESILNTPAMQASAQLLWRTIEETLGAGGVACRPLIARRSLGAAFVIPAVAHLMKHGAVIRFNARLRDLEIAGDRVEALRFQDEDLRPAPEDRIVMALPATDTGVLLPGVATPTVHHAIVNAHYRLDAPVAIPFGAPLLGLVGGTAHWLFLRGDVLSITVSAADDLAERDAEEIAALLWADAARALKMDAATTPPNRIVKEKRATFAQTPTQVATRPETRTACANLFLAGDWTNTGLPATIEGATRSGHAAAGAAMRKA